MPVKFQDYYQTLGVARTATTQEIRQAFRKLARIHHPDVAKDKVAGEEKFKEINEACEVLSDPEKRRRYDELGANWQSGRGEAPEPAAGGFGRQRSSEKRGGFRVRRDWLQRFLRVFLRGWARRIWLASVICGPGGWPRRGVCAPRT